MKKTKKLIGGIFGSGMALGAGSIGLSAMGGVPATNTAHGLANASAALPAVGTLGGMGMVLGQMKGMKGMMRRRR
jgi:hypothetical protein